jgi:hypothetical protein
MQSACATEKVEKSIVDKKENVDLDDLNLIEWLRSPNEKRIGAAIVEWPSEKRLQVNWPAYADTEENHWTFFAELIGAHEYWLREIRKKHPKQLRRAYVAPLAKERVRLIGTCLLSLCRENGFLPLTPSLRAYINGKAHAVARKKQKALTPAQPRLRARVWAARRKTLPVSGQELRTWPALSPEDYLERAELEASNIPWLSPLVRREHRGVAATFSDLAALLKPGERKTDIGNYREVVRSSDGATITATDRFGVQKTYTRSTLKRDGWSIEAITVKYSRPVRFTTREGNIVYSDSERETLFQPIAVQHFDGSKPVESIADIIPEIVPTAALLTDPEKKRRERLGVVDETDIPTAPAIPNRIRVKTGRQTYEPNTCVGMLSPYAWRNILYHKVRLYGDTFTIEGKNYRIAHFRISKEKLNVSRFVNMRGQLAWPCLNAVASKLAYLQRVSPQTNDYTNVLEKRLPLLLANIDTLSSENSTWQGRSPATQHLREQVIAEAA